MPDTLYPSNTSELAQKRRELSPDTEAAFQAFGQKVFAEGALPAKVKQIIAVAVAHVTQCPYCIKGHTKAALRLKCGQEGLTLILSSQLRKYEKLRRRRVRERTRSPLRSLGID
jgi:AhpD family alkylhydroperoxidase